VDVSIGPDQDLVVETAARLAEAFATTNVADLPVRDGASRGWRQLAETGFVGLRLPEPVGGAGTGVDVALVAEQFGRALSPVPFVGQAVLGPELLSAASASDDVLATVVAGERRVTVALDPTLRHLACVGRAFVFDAAGADAVLGLRPDGQVIELELGTELEPASSADLTRVLVEVDIDKAHPIGAPLEFEARTRVEALALSVLAADLVGVMQAALHAAVDYVRDRVQFGVPVGSFQAVQHLAAEAKVELEAARGSMWHGAWAVDQLDAQDALLAARQAKAYCSRAAREVTEIMTQLFGGIAITWEELAHLRVRRALFGRACFGDEHVQEDAIAVARLGAPARACGAGAAH
jgi:alkylation response protein AidB-like acyl-CoA dehydrogenase